MSAEILERNMDAMSVVSPLLQRQLKAISLAAHSIEKTEKSRPDLITQIAQLDERTSAAICFGMGNGEILDRSLTWLAKEDRLLLIVEKNPATIAQYLSRSDMSQLLRDQRLFFFSGTSEEEFSSILLQVFSGAKRVRSLQGLVVLKDSAVNQDAREFYARLEKRLQTDRPILSHALGHTADGLVGIRYLFQNLDWLRKTPGIQGFKDLFKNKPAIIVSTGPSLSKSLPILKQLESKVVLIAADASLKILLDAGISPHFVCSLERDVTSKPFFENLNSNALAKKSNLVAFPVVPPEVLAEFPGNQWSVFRTYLSHVFFNSALNRGALNCGHSVAHMCASFALHLGCNPIVLIGQDLSFDSKTLSTHSEGVAYKDWQAPQSEVELRKKLNEEGDELLMAEGNLEARVPTRGYYIVFAREFGVMASKSPATFINATEGGLKIPFIERKSLADLESTFTANTDAWTKIQSVSRNAAAAKTLDLTALRNRMDEILGHLNKEIPTLDEIHSNEHIELFRKFWLQLTHDHVFEGFVLETLGTFYIEIENQWAELSRLSGSTAFEQKRKVLKDFFSEARRILLDVRNLISIGN